MSSKSTKRVAAVGSAALAAVLALGAVPAHAGTQQGRFTFKVSDPYYTKTDGNGTFTGQVNMAGTVGRPAPMAWSFRTSPAIQAIATGRMTCSAGHMQLPYHDSHANVTVNYFWHSSVPNNRRNKNYTLYGNCTFPVQVGGRTGKADLGFSFNYSLFDGITPSMTAQDGGSTEDTPYTSDLKIAYDS
ncbi:hypothetical protein [Streptomyces sp. Ru72]|uniref:hypothetical protein n=1 Tax=Streptomyces sp. Ru72 TaxID=2080747 RepID=UPI0011AFF5B9|nr:hypothetical protein [Streptomyces sp. Ru72]